MASKTSNASNKSAAHFAVVPVFLYPTSSQQLVARSRIDMFALVVAADYTRLTPFSDRYHLEGAVGPTAPSK